MNRWAIFSRPLKRGLGRNTFCAKLLIAFKASATRKLRAAGCWRSSKTPWVERGSKRYLWTESDVINAVVYVEYDDQGESL